VSVRMWVRYLVLRSRLRIQCCCGVDHRCGLDLILLWLWYRPAAAVLIHLLAQELSYAEGVAIKNKIKLVLTTVA